MLFNLLVDGTVLVCILIPSPVFDHFPGEEVGRPRRFGHVQ